MKGYTMKKTKQVLAILGIIILVLLYLSTIFCSVFDNSKKQSFFAASIFATFIIPVLIWTYTFIYKIITKKNDELDDLRKKVEEKRNNSKDKF